MEFSLVHSSSNSWHALPGPSFVFFRERSDEDLEEYYRRKYVETSRKYALGLLYFQTVFVSSVSVRNCQKLSLIQCISNFRYSKKDYDHPRGIEQQSLLPGVKYVPLSSLIPHELRTGPYLAFWMTIKYVSFKVLPCLNFACLSEIQIFGW